MNETTLKRPQFMTHEPSKSYYEPQDPYVLAPSCHLNLQALAKYAKEKEKRLLT